MVFTIKEPGTYLIVADEAHIGQVEMELAAAEIKRLNEQEKTDKWRIDASDFKLSCDVPQNDAPGDFEAYNPVKRSEGYVWVFRSK